jgi:hypothetical protein
VTYETASLLLLSLLGVTVAVGVDALIRIERLLKQRKP